jgi:hypothetical protein
MNKIINTFPIYFISIPAFANVLDNEWLLNNWYPTAKTFWDMVLLCFWWLSALSISLIFLAIVYSLIILSLKIAAEK